MLLPVFFALAISTLLIGKNLFFLFFCLSFCSISVSISSLLSPSLVLYLLVCAWSLSLCLHLTVLFFFPLFLSLMPSLFRFLSLILARSSSSPCTLSLSLPCMFPHTKRLFLLFVVQVQKLQSILKPMMLRRLKEDVEKNLAPKQETIIEVSSEGTVTQYTDVGCRTETIGFLILFVSGFKNNL